MNWFHSGVFLSVDGVACCMIEVGFGIPEHLEFTLTSRIVHCEQAQSKHSILIASVDRGDAAPSSARAAVGLYMHRGRCPSLKSSH